MTFYFTGALDSAVKTLFICILLICYSCKEKVSITHEKVGVTECNCFPLMDGNLYGNVFVKQTQKGNFLKYTALNDSLFLFSCGRNKVEYIIDTFNCDKFIDIPDLIYENEDFIVFIMNGGTYSWLNIFVPLRLDRQVKYDNAIFIDTVNLRYATIGDFSDSLFVYDLVYQTKYFSRLNTHTTSENNIKITNISDTSICYQITDSLNSGSIFCNPIIVFP